MFSDLGRFSAAFFSGVLTRKRKRPIRVQKLRVTDYEHPGGPDRGPGELKKVEMETSAGAFALALKVLQPTYNREAHIWQFLGEAGELPVPEVFHVECDERSGAYSVLVEHVEPAPEGELPDERRAALAGAALARVHARFWGRTDQLPKVFHSGQSASLTDGVEPAVRRFLDRMSEQRHAQLYSVVPGIVPFLAKLLRREQAFFERRSRLKPTLLHGAFDDSEVLVRRRGDEYEAVLIDWERARPGAPTEDLAQYCCALPAEQRAAGREALASAYLEGLHAAGLAAAANVVNEELDRECVLLGARNLPVLCGLYLERRSDPDYEDWCKSFAESLPEHVAELASLLRRVAPGQARPTRT